MFYGVGKGVSVAWGKLVTSRTAARLADDIVTTATNPGQTSPGGFGTLDAIPDVQFARQQLVIRPDWKPGK